MFQKDLNATGVVSLGMPTIGTVGCVVFQVVAASGGWSGTALVKGRVGGAIPGTGATIPNTSLTGLICYNVATKAAVAAATGITAAGIYAVEAPGLEIVLDYTHTSGSALVYGVPLDYPLELLNTTTA